MTKSLIFDTETTGMILRDQPATVFGQPDMVQICAQLWDDDPQEMIEGFTQYVIPEKVIHPKAFQAHGISLEICQEKGIAPNLMLDHFLQLVEKADTIVAFNIAFDKKIIETAMYRQKKRMSLFTGKPMFCAMLAASNIMKIPNPRFPGEYKWPNQMEAYKHFVDPKGFDNAHDAEADVTACARIYYKVR